MRRNRGGFTIIEVMIFLVISGALLVAAMIAIKGQQNRTEFTQAMRDLDSKLQDSLNDVSTGNFSYARTCKVPPGLDRPQLIGAPVSDSSTLGTNSDCLFLGKALQFSTSPNSSTGGANDNARFAIYTVLGRRVKDGGISGNSVAVGSFDDANPTAMIKNNEDLTTYYDFEQGITTSHIYFTPSTGGSQTDGTYTMLGLYTAFSSAAGNVGTGNSDATQSVQPYVYKLGVSDFASPEAKNCIDSSNDPATMCSFDQQLSSGNSKGWSICFDSNNGTSQTAMITIYSTAQGVNTRLEYNPAGTCPAP